MGRIKVTPKDLEKFYQNVDELCAEIFECSEKEGESRVLETAEQES